MSTEAAQFFFAVLTVLAFAGTVALLVIRLLARSSEAAREWLVDIRSAALWLAFGVAATCTLGSLYFSEIADLIPCKLCWYQRIAMYPLAIILLIAAVRRDRGVTWYVAPLAVIGAGVAGYHYLIEWRPELDTGVCTFGVPCTAVWFREFGFISLPLMALVGFITILALLCVPNSATMGGSHDEVPPTSPN